METSSGQSDSWYLFLEPSLLLGTVSSVSQISHSEQFLKMLVFWSAEALETKTSSNAEQDLSYYHRVTNAILFISLGPRPETFVHWPGVKNDNTLPVSKKREKFLSVHVSICITRISSFHTMTELQTDPGWHKMQICSPHSPEMWRLLLWGEAGNLCFIMLSG